MITCDIVEVCQNTNRLMVLSKRDFFLSKQDLSYYCCLELQGEEDKLLDCLSQLTSKEAGERVHRFNHKYSVCFVIWSQFA